MNPEPSSAEDALELFLEARRAGEDPDPRVFAARFPEFAPDLACGLAALVALDRVTSEPTEESLPERIGAFRIVREIGRGGMGLVLEAVEEPLGRRVALKVLPPERLPSVSARARFRREAALAARLDHPGIATVYGAGVEGDRPWMAMRYIEGRTLASSIAAARKEGSSCVHPGLAGARSREGALAVAACLAKVARALHSAHEQGVVHRDIKPSNILVTADGSPVLLDFGLAIAREPDELALTRTGETPGTPAYFAPESLAGELPRPDVQSDVYSLGVTLYECLALRRPFDDPTPVALYGAIVAGSPPALRTLNKAVPHDLAVVTSTAMERDRSRRYRSARALAEDLEACVAGRPISARPVPLHGLIARWMKREPRQASLAGLLGAAVIAIALFVGNFWASRDVVRAAEKVAREQERERSLAEGYFVLRANVASADAIFSRVLASEPENHEALAGMILTRIEGHRQSEALALLADAPVSPGFDALRACCRQEPVDQDIAALSSAQSSALDLFLIGAALNQEFDRTPLSRQGEVQARAMAMLNEAVVRSPGPRSFMHIQRAMAANSARDERWARSASATLLALWPDSKDAVFAAGLALAHIDPAAARPILERATALDPRNADPFQVLGNVIMRLGDYETSELWLWRALDRRRDAEIYNSLAISLHHQLCFDEAISAARSAIAQDARNVRAWCLLGTLLFQSGDPEGSVIPSERALELDPWNSSMHGLHGMALFDLGRLQEARTHLEFAVALDPDALMSTHGSVSSPMWLHSITRLAQVLSALGERAAASEVVSAGLERVPNHGALLELRAELEAGK